MGTLSFADLQNLALPSLWDNSEILKFRIGDGRTFEEVVSDIQAGLTTFNGSLTTLPQYSTLWAAQDTPEVEYAVGDTNGFQESTDYGTPTPQRGATTGHIIGTKAWDRSVGWTYRYLQKARAATLDADVASVIKDARNLFQQQLLTRFFRSTSITVGATGGNVPFADGGTADSTYVPPVSMYGKTFASTHNHFLRQAATLTTANVDATIEHLWEHGHTAPYFLIIPDADLSVWAALSKWRAPTFADINYQAVATPTANLPDVGTFAGFYESPRGVAYVWSTPRLPTNYYGAYKLYGAGDQRNSLRVRFDPRIGFGYNLIPGIWVQKPAEMAVVGTEFGVGVGDRTNGVAVFLAASGNYVDPTIS